MTWRTSRAVFLLRNIGRASGFNRLFVSAAHPRDYESRFQCAMTGTIRPGDTVWDVGANVGLYSTLFSHLTGPTGHVVAWEPSPVNLKRLREAVSDRENVTVKAVALGQREGSVEFQQGADDLGASSKIVEGDVRGRRPGALSVQVLCGDRLVSSGIVSVPNVIKIDTEGFELDVLLGLSRTLEDRTLRAVCVELHFGILQERRLPRAPADIEQLLWASGFSVAWADSSHIVATRSS
jgi:FkbM family methyltransferase